MQLNLWLRRTIIGGIFILPFVPLVVSNLFFFPFITGKAFLFRIVTEIIFALWIILALRDQEYRPRKNLVLSTIALFVGVVFIADIFSANPYKSFWSNFERMEGFVTIAHLFAFFIVSGTVLKTRKLWERFFETSMWVSVIIAVYGILQLAGFFSIRQGSLRPDSTLGNATYFGVYMLLSFFIAWFLFLSRTGRARIVYGSVMIIELVALYITATRGAMLGLIGGLLLSALIIVLFEKKRPRLRKTVAIIFGASMIFIGAFVLFKDSPFLQNKGPLSRLATISLAEGAPRFMVWDMAFQGFKERPILGWGQESFNYVFNKYYNPNMYGQEQWFDRSHNIFLDWLIAGGLLGFISYLLLYGAAIFTLWRGPGSAFFSLAEKAVLTGLFGGYLVNNIFVFDQLTSYLIFFSILAFFYSQNVFQVPAPRDARYRRFDRVLVNRIIAPIVIILLIVGLYSINIKPMRAATTLTKALQPQNGGPKENLELFKRIFSYRTFGDTEAREQLAQISYAITTATSVPIDIKQAFFDLTKSELLLQLKRTPEDARYQFFMGTFLDRFRLYADAKPFLEKALALSPRKQSMLFELGTVYLNTGGIEKALEFFKRAMELAPDYREARLIYAVGAIYARDQVLARKILEPIATTTLLPDERFVTAYAAIGDFNSVLAIRQKMVEANPNQSSARLSLAAALLKVGRREESIIQIKKAIELDPNFKAQGDEIIKQIRAGWTP